jgi:hypothetical protein
VDRWIDDGLPELDGFEHRYFDLAALFDITRYIDILADSVSDESMIPQQQVILPEARSCQGQGRTMGSKDSEAGDFAPAANEWRQWS